MELILHYYICFSKRDPIGRVLTMFDAILDDDSEGSPFYDPMMRYIIANSSNIGFAQDDDLQLTLVFPGSARRADDQR